MQSGKNLEEEECSGIKKTEEVIKVLKESRNYQKVADETERKKTKNKIKMFLLT